MPERLRAIIVIFTLATAGILVAAGLSFFGQYIGTRVSGVPLSQSVIGGALQSEVLTLGSHALEFRGRTSDGTTLTNQVSFAVQAPNGGGGGDTGGGDDEREVNHTFDTFVSQTPVGIVNAYELSGAVDASLTIRVQTHTEPPVVTTAQAAYGYSTPQQHDPAVPESFKGEWILSNIQTTGGGAGVAVPTLTVLADDSSFARKSFITLTANQRYRATVTVEGSVVRGDVAPVLMPRFQMQAFVGPKKVLMLKGRYADQPLPDTTHEQQNAPFGANNAAIVEMLERMNSRYNNQSTGQFTFDYEIKEATFSTEGLSQLPLPAGVCPRDYLAHRMLQNAGISPERSPEEVDLVVFSMYPAAVARMQQEFNCRLSVDAAFTRGVWIDFANPGTFAHELGHGLGFNHVEFPRTCERNAAQPQTLSIEHLYPADSPQTCLGKFRLTGHVMAGGFPSLYYHLLDRASLGWLTAGQVGLVTQSGIYDLYSERDDYSAVADAPLILQVPVEFDGYVDFVYLTLVNQGSLRDQGTGSIATWTDALQGVRLSASSSNRINAMKHGFFITDFLYGPGETDASIPIGGQVHLAWPGTDVRLEVVSVTREEDRTHAKVKVTINGVPAPTTAAPLPAPVLQTSGDVAQQPTLRWQPVAGAARYHVRIYALNGGLNGGYDVSVPAPTTEFRVPQPLQNVSTDYDYEWNVQAIDAQGNGGQWSTLQRLNVVP